MVALAVAATMVVMVVASIFWCYWGFSGGFVGGGEFSCGVGGHK